MREIFVTELVKEVLGPRNGLREIFRDIRNTPLNEYITGVLAPLTEEGERERDIESEAELPVQDSQVYEEETLDVDVSIPPYLSPALDPRNRPPSMGLSFIVKSSKPTLDVCLTWARYEMLENRQGWQRNPKYFIKKGLVADHDQVIWIGPDGKEVAKDKAEISLHVIVSRRGIDLYLITFYLVNRIKFRPSQNLEKPTTEHHIFQPQIRVICLSLIHI